MRLRQLLQINLRAGPKLGDDLSGAKCTELAAALQGFPLGVGM